MKFFKKLKKKRMVPSFCILIRSSFQPKELKYLCPHRKDSKGLPLIPVSMLISVLFPTLLLEQHRIHVSSTGPLLEKRGCFLNPFDARNQYS